MNCEQAQEIILTDYLDGCCTESSKARLEAHLALCSGCREFCSVARENLVEPFEALPRERLPESVVEAVRQQVLVWELARGGWVNKFLEAIKGWNLAPGPAVAWVAAGVMCFMMVGIGLGVNDLRQAKQNERVLFLAEVAELSVTRSQAGADYGTSIESYFL